MIEALLLVAFVGTAVVFNNARKKNSPTATRVSKSATARPERVMEVAPRRTVEVTVSYGGSAALDGRPSRSVDCWVPPGQVARVGSRRIPGGMLYVGQNLPASGSRYSVDAALIDPKLPRNDAQPDRSGQGMTYWPSYSGISEGQRSAYLDWLEGGRQDPDVYIGYVFLFFYGLERRALHDAQEDAAAVAEQPMILAEIERLLSIYRQNNSFQKYAKALVSLLRDQLQTQDLGDRLEPYRQSHEIPLDVRVAVGRLALQSKPLPAGLAFSWATSDPGIRLRTPAHRCAQEFESLFLARYEKAFGDGITLPTCKRQVVAEYRPASSSFGGVISRSTDVPDVTSLVGPRRKLEVLIEEVTSDLEAYSRKLGRDPTEADAVGAAALLPPELISTHVPKSIGSMLTRLQEAVAGESPCLIDSEQVIGTWLSAEAPKLSVKDSVAAATMLSHVGIGIEPDVRFGGPRISAGERVAIFALAPDDPEAPSAAFAAASLLLHLSSHVAAADESISMEERSQLEKHVSKALHLEDGERRRLAAHIHWLLANPPGMAGVKKRVDELGREQREAIGEFLVGVAAADGQIDAAEVRTLTKLFKVLGLDPARVHTALHDLHARIEQPEGPVTVASARPSPPGEPIPRPAVHAEIRASAPRGTALDQASIERKLLESAAVSRLLGSIFAEHESTEISAAKVPPSSGARVIDEAHTSLLRALAASGGMLREAYDALAEQHGLMPDGALEALNSLAWDTCNAPVVEDLGDMLEIDLETCNKLLAQ